MDEGAVARRGESRLAAHGCAMKLSPTKLAERLTKGSLDPIYVVTGEQDLLREVSLARIQQATVGEQTNAFNFERFDGEEADIDRILDGANMMPMMGGRRFLLVRRGLRYIENPRARSTDVKKGSPTERLLGYAEDPSPHSVVTLELQKKPDGRRKAWKQLEKLVVVVQCDPPKAPEVASFIQDQAKQRGLKLGRDSVNYLMELFGSDLRRLVNEMEKLSLYVGDDPVDLETLGELLGRGRAQSIFKFTDAVGERDARQAIELLDRLVAEGEPPLRILAAVGPTGWSTPGRR